MMCAWIFDAVFHSVQLIEPDLHSFTIALN
jgi:hypothetical protein